MTESLKQESGNVALQLLETPLMIFFAAASMDHA